MNSKFKIGDKVKVINKDDPYFGEEYIVESLHTNGVGWEWVYTKNKVLSIYEKFLTLITDDNQTNNIMEITNMQKKFLDEDTLILIKAGFLSNTLELTALGVKNRDEIMFDKAQKELITMAKNKVSDEEAKK